MLEIFSSAPAAYQKCPKTQISGRLTNAGETAGRGHRQQPCVCTCASRAWHFTNILTEQFPGMNCAQLASAITKCAKLQQQQLKTATATTTGTKLRQKCGKMKWSNGQSKSSLGKKGQPRAQQSGLGQKRGLASCPKACPNCSHQCVLEREG